MSNKLIISVIIVLSLITIGVASLTQLNKGSGNVAMNQSSVVVSSVKTEAVSSSSSVQSQVSSTVVSSAQKVVESVKAESQFVAPITTKCNLSESENLVKTEDGCFELQVGDGVFKDNPVGPKNYSENLLQRSSENLITLKQLALNYYQKNKSQYVSKKHIIYLESYTKQSEQSFRITVGMLDDTYFINNSSETCGRLCFRETSIYEATKQKDVWTYKFINKGFN